LSDEPLKSSPTGWTRPSGAEIVARRHPEIAHVVDRREPGEMLAVGTDAQAANIGIVEENFSRDQIGFRSDGTSQSGERQRGERRGAAHKIAAVDRADHAELPGERSRWQCARAPLPQD
jgi:hypothetical protein